MIEVLRAGAQTTVQDSGRSGYEALGISRGGALDLVAYTLANRLVGNQADRATLECVLTGPTLRFTEPAFVATAGVASPTLNGAPMASWSGFSVAAGEVVGCERIERARGYVAVAGGIDVPTVLGSRSTNLESGFGGLDGRALRPGDTLPIGVASSRRNQTAAGLESPEFDQPLILRVVAGPRFDDFRSASFAAFLKAEYLVSHQNNHVGIRLEGPLVEAVSHGNRVSEPMPIGGIQITPAGQPVILLAARGTIGGYPVIATVITPDVWRLGQARPGERVGFREMSYDEARAATLQAYVELGLQ